ncbi:MAG: hypothetical protein GY719_14015 [bacterium]|nr:hypothetical protein [bacterium]
MKPIGIRRRFDDAELERIRQAAQRAEKRTSGEVVAYLVSRVDDSDDAAWKGAALGALAAAAVFGLVHWLGGFWGGPAVLWLTLPTFSGAAAGYLLTAWSPALERWLIPTASLERRVRLRAEAAFLDEEVFRTRDRTGILIFIALFEHRALILADSGIHEKVAEGQWQRLVVSLTSGIRADRTVEALEETILACGRLLEEHGVSRRDDDRNELADEPRLSER